MTAASHPTIEIATHMQFLNLTALVARPAFKGKQVPDDARRRAGLRTFIAGFARRRSLGDEPALPW
jgi:hypothetical protein